MSKIMLSVMRLGFRAYGAIAPERARGAAFRMFTSPPRAQGPSPEENAILERAERRRVAFDGEQLAVYTWRRPASVPERGRVLVCHAWGSRAASFHAFVDPLLARGFDVIGYDAPAHGDSAKRRTTLLESALAMLAVAEAVGPLYAVIGHSYGGLLATYVTAGGKPLPRRLPVERLVTIGAPDGFGDLTKQLAKILALPDRIRGGVDQRVERVLEQPIGDVRSSKWLADSKVPALVIHDRHDREMPFEHGEALAAASSAVRFLATSELGHRRILRAPAVLETAADYLLESKLGADAPAGAIAAAAP